MGLVRHGGLPPFADVTRDRSDASAKPLLLVRALAAFLCHGEAHGNEAMLHSDMDVERLATTRVAEHFTVKHGQIMRRQIHDTAAVRAAGFGNPSTGTVQ